MPSRSRLCSSAAAGAPDCRQPLGRDEDLLARDAATPDRRADAPLVAVELRGVDVPVSGLERPLDRVLGLGALVHLPHPEPEHRHPHAVSEVLEHRSIVHVRCVVSLTVSDSCQTTPTNADQPWVTARARPACSLAF